LIGTDALHGPKARSQEQHTQVRACNPSPDASKTLGIPSLQIHHHAAPLISISEALCTVRDKIPLTMKGTRVVPAVLDPLRATFISPDHLFNNHLSACIDFALSLLPTPAHRRKLNLLTTRSAKLLRLTAQKRLFNESSSNILALTFSDLVAVSVILPYCFRAVHFPSGTLHLKDRAYMNGLHILEVAVDLTNGTCSNHAL